MGRVPGSLLGRATHSRNGTDLTPLFPDLTPILTARLPADLILDGELVAWDPSAGRLDFGSLQARMTAGKRIRAVARQRPAQFVAFDVLAAGGVDLRGRPSTARRLLLERALSGIASPIVLCQQTDDVMTAREWTTMTKPRPGFSVCAGGAGFSGGGAAGIRTPDLLIAKAFPTPSVTGLCVA